MDNVSPAHRSTIMSKVRSRDTQPEMRVRHALHALGLRYRLHRKDLPGSPDVVFPRQQVAVFVHGCFWHQHPGCKRASIPETRRKFWSAKLKKNVERDCAALSALEIAGWSVEVIWECETKNSAVLTGRAERIAHRLRNVNGRSKKLA
jgi:DNA mismatch endonuclease (patch repair protein)